MTVPPTAADVAARSGSPKARVSKVLLGYAGVAPATRAAIIDAYTELGGNPDLIPKPGTYQPAPKGPPLTPAERRARAAARQAARRTALALCEQAGMTTDDLVAWLHDHHPRATRWAVVSLWTDPANAEVLEAATRMLRERARPTVEPEEKP